MCLKKEDPTRTDESLINTFVPPRRRRVSFHSVSHKVPSRAIRRYIIMDWAVPLKPPSLTLKDSNQTPTAAAQKRTKHAW